MYTFCSFNHVYSRSREDLIVSVGQFRPEKNHLLQLKAFQKYLEMTNSNKVRDYSGQKKSRWMASVS